MKQPNFSFRFGWIYVFLIGGIIWMLFSNSSGSTKKIEWPQVENMISQGDVEEIDFVRNDYKGFITLRQSSLEKNSSFWGGKIPKRSPHFMFLVSNKFNPEQTFGELNSKLPDNEKFKIVIENDDKVWSKVLDWMFFPILLLILYFFVIRRMNNNLGGGSGGPGIFSVGKAPSKLADKAQLNVTFKDVAGLYGAKEEVMEIVDFLKNPDKYRSLGAKIPKGALLVGPPGTGKTLLAKAVAGEADVPFFSISGSDFVEMFVGVGASRVRDLFAQAKEKAPCIVFIDEIDAIGRARSKNGGFSSNDERENTLNQLLTEMDGFGTNSGVIIIAATNRVDILDKALLRAGRFDRQIYVDLPELKEREEIFNVHIKKLKLESDFDVAFMAKHTPGFSGADIANLCNEAALIAARKNKSEISKEDFLDAVDRIIGGLERKSATIITDDEKKTIAYHEAGHAVVGWLLPYCDPVFKVSLVPRGQALGLTWSLPKENKIVPKEALFQKMCGLIGGRVAEEIINNQLSTGALNDLQRITSIAYSMVKYYGMSSKVGHLSFYNLDDRFAKPYSETLAEAMDEEVKNLVDAVHNKTFEILTNNREGFDKLAQLLLEKEVVMADDIEQIFGPKVGENKQSKEDEQKDEISSDEIITN